MSDKVCTIPWNSIYIGDGWTNLCCNATGAMKNDDGSDSTHKDINAVRTNNEYTQLKTDLLNGVENTRCTRCWKMEPDSFRGQSNKAFPDTAETIRTTRTENMPLEHISIHIGNECNLACRMCAPHSSSLIAKEWKRGGHPMGRDLAGGVTEEIITSDRGIRSKTFLADPEFLQFITDNHHELKAIYIAGGEPFIIIEQHIQFLQLLVDLGVSKNITVEYSTNGTNTNLRRFREVWSNFKQIKIMISCDGIEEVYDYVRWPNTWQKMKKSLDYYYDMSRNDSDVVNFSMACTVGASTIGNIIKTDTYIKKAYGIDIIWIPIDFPQEMSLKSVPLNVLEELYENPKCPTQIRPILLTHINNYNEVDSKKCLADFVKTSEWQDEYRNQSLYEFIPAIEKWQK